MIDEEEAEEHATELQRLSSMAVLEVCLYQLVIRGSRSRGAVARARAAGLAAYEAPLKLRGRKQHAKPRIEPHAAAQEESRRRYTSLWRAFSKKNMTGVAPPEWVFCTDLSARLPVQLAAERAALRAATLASPLAALNLALGSILYYKKCT